MERVAAARKGDVSWEELIEGGRRRAERWQPATRAFSQLWPEPEPGAASGVLAGVPVAVKDLFDVAGRETTGCSEAYRGNVASIDAPVVRALRNAGAIVIGKT